MEKGTASRLTVAVDRRHSYRRRRRRSAAQSCQRERAETGLWACVGTRPGPAPRRAAAPQQRAYYSRRRRNAIITTRSSAVRSTSSSLETLTRLGQHQHCRGLAAAAGADAAPPDRRCACWVTTMRRAATIAVSASAGGVEGVGPTG